MLLSELHTRAALCAALLTLACKCKETDERHRDAGVASDARALDAGDGGTDARPDAGDAAPDAGDAGFDPDDPGWVPLKGIPKGCVIERARNPAAFSTMEWEPCPKRPGCQRLIPDGFLQRRGFHDGEMGYFFRYLRSDLGEDSTILMNMEGMSLAAWREPPASGSGLCFANLERGGDHSVAFEIQTRKTGVRPNDVRLFHAPVDSIGDLTQATAVIEEALIGGSSPQDLDVSDTTAAFEFQPGAFVVVVEDDTVRRMESLPGDMAGIPQNVEVVGNHVFWEEWGSLIRIAHGAIDQPTDVFLAIDGVDVRSFASDGTDMAWAQCYGPAGGCDRVEIWTAPYVESPEALESRWIADSPVPVAGGNVWHGRLFHLRDTGRNSWEVVFYDLADGRRRAYEFPERYDIYPLYATQEELVVAATRPRNLNLDTVFRVDLASIPYGK